MKPCEWRKRLGFFRIAAILFAVSAWPLTVHAAKATGGSSTTNYWLDGTHYQTHIFLSNGTFEVSGGTLLCDVLVVGGGGGSGGGKPSYAYMAGGGGGQVTATSCLYSGSSGVIIGTRGAAGSDSVNGGVGGLSSIGPVTAAGGLGGKDTASTTLCGNGGASGNGHTGGVKSSSAAGGGGGNEQNGFTGGASGGAGGNGSSNALSGVMAYYGGGGGGKRNASTKGPDGLGGGAANCGGGGSSVAVTGIAGGPGLVMVRYALGAPEVSNAEAEVTESLIMLKGFLVSTGYDANVSAAVFWGTSDAGNSPAGWARTNVFPGWAGEGPLAVNVAPPDLAGTRHYFRFFASNSLGSAWAEPAGTFSTPGAPGVNNADGATNVGPDSATLRGAVTGGQPDPALWIYYGTVNQGENKALWDHEIPVAAGADWTFSATVGGLTPGVTYQYMCYASNRYGSAWSAAATFTCLGGTARVWDGEGANALASNPTNWTGDAAPGPGDGIILDATSQKAMTWDLNIPLFFWSQVAYTNVVTLNTRYPGQGAFTNLAILGNCVISNGTWTHPANTGGAVARERIRATVGGNFELANGAAINLSGRGYASASGPGAGSADSTSYGDCRAASYGGVGSVEVGALAKTYGSVRAPVDLGSGAFYIGGGAIELHVGGLVILNGIVSAIGQAWDRHGGATGGSVYMVAGGFAGGGLIQANGGGANSGDHGGGGGRIALIATNSDTFGNVVLNAFGGDAGINGAAGTVYLEGKSAGPGRGTVLVNNNGMPTGYTTPIPPELQPEQDLSHVTLVVTNLAYVKIATNVMMGDLFIRTNTATRLYLQGNTLKLRAPYHADWGRTNAVVYDGGQIVWPVRGTLVFIR